MEKVILNGTGFKISRLSFGASRLHRLVSSRSRLNILSAAFDHGMAHMDTSPYYGFGIAENELGKFLRSHRTVTVATKFGLYPPFEVSGGYTKVFIGKALGKIFPRLSKPIRDWSMARSKKSLEQSLRRLGVDCIDILLLHEPQWNMVDSDDVLGWLADEKRRGTIKAWGLAGDPTCVRPWVTAGHRLGMVLQVKDGVEKGEADDLRAHGCDPQITYGYISSSLQPLPKLDARLVLKRAFEKNVTGSIIVSASSVEHIRELCEAAEECEKKNG